MNPNNKHIVADFVKYCARELNIQKLPHVKLIADKDWVSTYRSFGEYNPGTYTVKVYYLGRNTADVLRSLAHELVHHRQEELGMIEATSGETGSEIENEANALAGVLLRDYGKQNVKIYDLDNKLNELKITVYPKQQGVDVDDPEGELETAPTVDMPLSKLVLNEPAIKMKSPESQKNLKSLIKAIKAGKPLPPIVVRKLGDKYQILDGHHRYFAMRALGIKNAKAIIVNPKDIEVVKHDYVMKEIGEGTKAYSWNLEDTDEDGNYWYGFETDQFYYQVGIANLDDGMYDLSFNVVTKDGTFDTPLDTNEGATLKVMSTVVEIAKDFISKEDPEIMIFRPIKTKEKDKENDMRRSRLYGAYLKKNIPSNYNLMSLGDSYRIVKK